MHGQFFNNMHLISEGREHDTVFSAENEAMDTFDQEILDEIDEVVSAEIDDNVDFYFNRIDEIGIPSAATEMYKKLELEIYEQPETSVLELIEEKLIELLDAIDYETDVDEFAEYE